MSRQRVPTAAYNPPFSAALARFAARVHRVVGTLLPSSATRRLVSNTGRFLSGRDPRPSRTQSRQVLYRTTRPRAAVCFRRSTASPADTTRIAVRTATGGIVLQVDGHAVAEEMPPKRASQKDANREGEVEHGPKVVGVH